jgi:DNA polymerase-3 subunit beta
VIKGSVTVRPQAFAAAVKWAAKFLDARPALPIQGGLLLDVEGGKMSIVGHNESLTARAVVEVDGDATGQAVVSGRLLAALVATFGSKPVTISGDGAGQVVTLTAGSWRGTLPAMDAGDFPSPPPAPPVIGRLRGDDIATAIRQAATAGSDDEKQAPAFHGLHLTFGENELVAMATNRSRAARAVIGCEPQAAMAGLTALVHAATMEAVADSFAGPDDVWVGLGNSLGLASQTRAVIVRLMGEVKDFPVEPVRNLFSVRHPQHAQVRAADLQVPLKRAQLMQEKDGPVRVRFSAGAITLLAAAEQLEQDSAEAITAEYTGPDHELWFNPRYFGEALASAPGETVDIALTTEKITGVVITVPGNEDWRHLLMPIKK